KQMLKRLISLENLKIIIITKESWEFFENWFVSNPRLLKSVKTISIGFSGLELPLTKLIEPLKSQADKIIEIEYFGPNSASLQEVCFFRKLQSLYFSSVQLENLKFHSLNNLRKLTLQVNQPRLFTSSPLVLPS